MDKYIEVDDFESIPSESRLAYINHAHLLWDRGYVLSEFSMNTHIDHPYDLAIVIWKQDKARIVEERARQEELRRLEELAHSE